MPSTLSIRRINEEDIEQYAMWVADGTASNVSLPSFQRSAHKAADKTITNTKPAHNHSRSHRNNHASHPVRLAAAPEPKMEPKMVPPTVPGRQTRKLPLLVRSNRLLRTALVSMCGLAIVGYGLDVATSNDVAKMQEQARRLNEQNSELSAQLLRNISFEGIQKNIKSNAFVGRFGLKPPDQVRIVKELQAPPLPSYKPSKHNLPVMSGY
ncbi:MAG TPA: hypothetical protein V6C72_15560 [Chroococcales cyanobacterium]